MGVAMNKDNTILANFFNNMYNGEIEKIRKSEKVVVKKYSSILISNICLIINIAKYLKSLRELRLL